MFQLPPIPTWDALHPIIIHFPIALFLTAPVLILLGALLPQKLARGFLLAALVMMTLGTIGAFIAVSTGEAAGELAERWRPGVESVLERHEELAETTRTVLAILTGVFAVVAVGPMFFKKPLPRIAHAGIHLGFLVLFIPAGLLLANTAHLGGTLVHEYGVHALMPGSAGGPAAAPDYSAPLRHDDDDD